MPRDSWRATAARVIQQALASGHAKGLEGKALEKHVSAAYPFGERANWPYRMWCEEFRMLVKGERRSKAKASGSRPTPLATGAGKWPGLTDRQREALGL